MGKNQKAGGHRAGGGKEIEMKKALLLGGAALMAFALVFSACKDAYDLTTTATETETVPSLGGPGNLKAVNDHEGVIALSWNPVFDAASYEVWRETGDAPAAKLGDVSAGSGQPSLFADKSLRYYDIAGTDNLLVAGTEYTYTVVAKSATSTSVPRAIEVVQNGTSRTSVTPDKIPAPEGYTVPAVTGIAFAAVTNSNGQKVVRISWDLIPNPAVTYKVKFRGSDVTNTQSLSPEGKVTLDYTGYSQLTDGEKYKAEIAAVYAKDYYKASAPAAAVYTHSAPQNIIEGGSFRVSAITLSPNGVSNGSYNLSVYWKQSPKAPAGVSYELYRHETQSGSVPNGAEWEKVDVAIPAADDTGLIQVILDGDKVPAYRQQWKFKLVAKVNDEKADEDETDLNNGAWGTPSFSLSQKGSATSESKKIVFSVYRVTYGLYAGDTVEFYAVQKTSTNNIGQTIVSDEKLGQSTKIGSLTKTDLESISDDDRKVTSPALATGNYAVYAYFRNGSVFLPLNGGNAFINNAGVQ
jgi:hypothetical protein